MKTICTLLSAMILLALAAADEDSNYTPMHSLQATRICNLRNGVARMNDYSPAYGGIPELPAAFLSLIVLMMLTPRRRMHKAEVKHVGSALKYSQQAE